MESVDRDLVGESKTFKESREVGILARPSLDEVDMDSFWSEGKFDVLGRCNMNRIIGHVENLDSKSGRPNNSSTSFMGIRSSLKDKQIPFPFTILTNLGKGHTYFTVFHVPVSYVRYMEM